MRQIYVDYEKEIVMMTKKFAKKAMDPTTKEYKMLCNVRMANPSFKVETHTIKKNPNKESYKGLTYDYMREYIKRHTSKEEIENALYELDEQIFRSNCHSIRYPQVKEWFLKTYPSVEKYGVNAEAVEVVEGMLTTLTNKVADHKEVNANQNSEEIAA